jgi:pimeloyl-ACP methyl ester carboxylesterase
VTVEHPRTGESAEIVLERAMLINGIRGTLYVPDLAALVPLGIDSARSGDYAPLLAQTLMLTDAMEDNLAEGMFLSVVCSEDVPFISDDDVARETNGTRIGSQIVEMMRESCALWRRADVPDGYREPVEVDVPTLVLSGDLDPVTPPRWGEHAAESLPHARHVVVPGAGHGTLGVPCMDGVLADFVAGADPDALDVSCLDEHLRPRFFVDFAGPSLAAR